MRVVREDDPESEEFIHFPVKGRIVPQDNLVAHHPKIRKEKVKVDTVSLVAQRERKTSRATSGTKAINERKETGLPKLKNKSVPPPKIGGHEWRQAGKGWALWKRVPALSDQGKRTSERRYVRYVTQKAIERIYRKNGRKK